MSAASQVKCTELYSILGVPSNASQKEITKAYRLRAIQLHPDKHLENERETATIDFQALQAAYQILREPEKRKYYDRTGLRDIDEDLETAVSRWSGSCNRISTDDLLQFELSYLNSKEEEDDIIDFYNRFNGDVSLLLQYVPLSQPKDIDRYLDIIYRLQTEKRIEAPLKNYAVSVERLRREAKKYEKRAKKEAEELSCNTNTSAELILALKANSKRRAANSFIDALEEKYTSSTMKRKKKKV